MGNMKWIDVPPVWLFIAALVTWWISQLQPGFLRVGGVVVIGLGTLLICIGIVLILLAAYEMRRHRTTIIPHLQAANLVSTGIFARSRNPIYLGDAMILAGLALRWEAPIAVLLVPVFAAIITKRFILDEEARLQTAFGADFSKYRETTPRWF